MPVEPSPATPADRFGGGLLVLWRGAVRLGAPLLERHLKRRAARGKEDPARLDERRGRAALPRPAGRLVWVHAASVGESLSVLPLIDRLVAPPHGLSVLITSGTVTSARLLAERLPAGAHHQFAPLDHPAWVARFLDHWRPDAVLWVESELWPTTLAAIARRRLPAALLNGRLSAGSLAGWRRAPGLARRLLGTFRVIHAQSPEDAARLAALAGRPVDGVGNLKRAAPPLPAAPEALAALAEALGPRPRWLAASTHPGEEALAGRLHQGLARRHPGLLTVIAPRHPERGPRIAAELAGQGLNVARRAAGQAPTSATDIYLADTLGEMGLLYRQVPLVLIGKSLLGRGGQNPIEPARLGCAVLHGPHMDNFASLSAEMDAAGAALEVADEAALAAALDRLLSDPEAVAGQGRAAAAWAAAEAQAVDRVEALLAPLLELPEAAA
ncbi:3-deoxy-D-manno-octulosonic acid transferase [Roseospirillum parvum]|uniref:3-deoxy-D-manno-octulosonic acid transferase n=1 Tax=Roseospirillum parvum TaxID=83401 RepID=A0A1G8BP82_9PROT|nr:glycosyltransferase N-terminal domain-containing protein [Roseospirillum parvum]SDH34400.1 3-deoxy-D-manno-octulosonic-acid transferase [Roseospirillum parvum]